MVRVSPASPSGASGELSELMYGRVDFVRFQNGLRKCRGFVVLPEGPVTRIPGTEFLGITAANSDARLSAYIFKDEDAVLLEWTQDLLRFWRQGSLVESGGNPYVVATEYSVAEAHKLHSLNSGDRIYLTNGINPPRRLSRFALDNWTIEDTVFQNGPFLPRNLDQTFEIQASDVVGEITLTSTKDLFIDPGHVGVLFELREIDTSDTPYWSADLPISVGEENYYNGRVYRVAGFDASNYETGGSEPTVGAAPNNDVSADAKVLWTAIANNNNGGVPDWSSSEVVEIGDRRFSSGWTIEVVGFDLTGKKSGINPPVHTEGRWLGEKDGVIWEHISDGVGVVRITAITDVRTATGTVEKRLPGGLSNRPTYRWAEGSWSTLKGFPRTIGSYRQRHVYGGTPASPRVVWPSVLGGTTDMTAGGNDDDAFSYTLDSDERENGEILFLQGFQDALMVGTTAGEFYGRKTDADRTFAEETADFDNDTNQGAADIRPVIAKNALVFVGKGGRKLYAAQLGQNGRFTLQELTAIARHILGDQALKVVYQQTPVPILWIPTGGGQLVGMSFDPEQQLLGFHRHDLAGGFLVDLEVMPSDDGVEQVLELIVRRNFGGTEYYCRERMREFFVDLDGTEKPIEDAWHLFCAKRWQGAENDVISDLDHLEGQTVVAWTNIGAFTDLVVTSGDVVLPRKVTSAIVGLDASELQRYETLDVGAGQPDGGDDGRNRVHRRTGIRLHRSAGGTFQVVIKNSGKSRAGRPTPIFDRNAFEETELISGVFDIGGHKGWGAQSHLVIRPEPGAPLTIVGRTPTLMITDS